MIFHPTTLDGVFEITLADVCDERGSFATTFDAEAFADAGLVAPVAQSAISFNPSAGTLRGLHLQSPPHGQAKLVRCTAGAIFDVVVDVRAESPTRGEWCSFELRPRAGRLVYVPEGVAHGLQTLEPDTEVSYQLSRGHVPKAARGVRWDDPAIGISWPLAVSAISEADRSWPDWVPG